MKTAVIVPVKNEMLGLHELTDALLSQVTPPDKIVFIDAGSTDGTLEFLDNLTRQCRDRVKLVKAPGSYPGAARNAGIASTDAHIIAQIDGGHLINGTWLATLKEPIIQNKADHVTGNVLTMPVYWKILNFKIDAGALYSASLLRGKALRPIPDHPISDGKQQPEFCAGGANTAYLRKIWEKTGGFPDWIRSGEDPLFMEKLEQQTLRYAFTENATSYWQLGPGLWQVLQRHYYGQKAKFRTVSHLKKDIRNIGIHILLPILLMGSFFSTAWFYCFIVLMCALTGIQTAKSLYTFFRRTKQRIFFQDMIAIIMMPYLEFLSTLAKIAGTYKGLLEFFSLQQKKDWTDKVTAYLTQCHDTSKNI